MSYAEAQYTIDEVLAGMKKNMVAGNEPNNLKNIIVLGGDGHNIISFEAQDTVLDGQVITTTAGVIVRRKIGAYPDDENDGDFVLDVSGAELDKYNTEPYIDEGLVNGTEYFYRFFPYSSYGMMNRSMKNTASSIPHVNTIWGFHQNFLDTNPDTCITYLGSATGYNPMHTIYGGSPSYTKGSWANWEWLQKNKPYCLDADGKPVIAVDPSAYNKSIGGEAIDYSNEGFGYDYFAWFPKLYMKEIYAADGNSRDVYFALKREGDTWDYIPVGFYNKNGEELEGLWLPMFIPYITASQCRSIYYKTILDGVYNSVSSIMGFIENRWGEERGVALGGPILNVIRDLLYLLYRSTDIQKHAGNGFSMKNSLVTTGSTVNGSVGSATGQGFFGYYVTQNNTGSHACRIFHSVVFLTSLRQLFDPYSYSHGGRGFMTKNYSKPLAETEPGKDGFTQTNILYTPSSTSRFPAKLKYCGDGYGSVPDFNDNSGSSSTGLTDRTTIQYVGQAKAIFQRFGDYSTGLNGGIAYQYLSSQTYTYGQNNITVAPMLLPDVGFDPTV